MNYSIFYTISIKNNRVNIMQNSKNTFESTSIVLMLFTHIEQTVCVLV